MNFKRLLEGSEPSDRVPKRRLDPSSSLLRNANSFPDQDFTNWIVDLVREVVREQIDRIIPIILGSSSRILNNPVQSNGEAHHKLQFTAKLPETVYTGNKILADGSPRVLIELVDSRTGSRVTTGPLSSLKIEIVALEGDFDPDNSNFNEKVVVERQGHRPILNGDLTVTLTQGLGFLGNVTITDNSSWIRCGKFRLGARVAPRSRVEERVQQASSDAFKVKDHRGLTYEKHYPPKPNSEVWRLEKIGKGGKYCVRLNSVGIQTVKTFRRFYEIDRSLLKKTLGSNGNEISDKIWEVIVGHAASCKIDNNEMFTYSSPGPPNLELLFDQFYGLKGATFDGREYCPIDKLNVHQRIFVQNLKQQAFENLNQLIPVNVDQLDRFLGQQEISATLSQEFGSTSTSTFCNEAPGSHFSEVSEPQIYNPEYVQPQTVAGNFTTVDNMWSQRLHGANNFGPCTTDADQNGPQVHLSADFFPSNSSWTSEDFNRFFLNEPELAFTSSASNRTFCMGLSNEPGPSLNLYIRNRARSRVAWCKIRAAIKWRSVRRNVARRNLAATRQQVSCV